MKKPRIFRRKGRLSALDAAAARETEVRDGGLARTSASRERQAGLSAPMRDARDRGSADAAAGKAPAGSREFASGDEWRAYNQGYAEARGPYIRDWRARRQAGASRNEGRRGDPAGEPPLDLARRELQTGLSAPMRDLQNRDPEAFADAMDMSFRLAPRRSPGSARRHPSHS